MPLYSHVSFPLNAGDPTITVKPARLTKYCLLPGCESPCLPFPVVVAFTIGAEARSDRGWVSISVVQPQATTWALTSAAVDGFVMASSCLHPMRLSYRDTTSSPFTRLSVATSDQKNRKDHISDPISSNLSPTVFVAKSFAMLSHHPRKPCAHPRVERPAQAMNKATICGVKGSAGLDAPEHAHSIAASDQWAEADCMRAMGAAAGM